MQPLLSLRQLFKPSNILNIYISTIHIWYLHLTFGKYSAMHVSSAEYNQNFNHLRKELVVFRHSGVFLYVNLPRLFKFNPFDRIHSTICYKCCGWLVTQTVTTKPFKQLKDELYGKYCDCKALKWNGNGKASYQHLHSC